MKVLVTGATGFVGRRVVEALLAQGHSLRRALRRPAGSTPQGACEDIVVGELGPGTDWTVALAGVDAVVHLAARAHVLNDTDPDPEAAFMRTNAGGAAALASAAAAAGVRHLVFVSSIGVHGMSGNLDSDSPVAPQTAYGRSKAEAERLLAGIAQASGLRMTVLRPPLVYGTGAPGNLERLMRGVARGLPIPLASVRNQRSLVGVDNLASAIGACLVSSGEGIERYTIADRERLSTPQLIRVLAQGMQRRPRLLPFPVLLLRLLASVLGKRQQIEQLCGSLVVDGEAFARRYGWTQPQEQRQGLMDMAAAFASPANEVS